jgi:iron complex outermembrane receptor protein
VSWKVSDGVNAYASYSQGWKAGSFDPRGRELRDPGGREGFRPGDAGLLRTGSQDHVARRPRAYEPGAFYSDYKDMQIPGSVAIDSDGDGVNDGFVGTVTNAAKSTIKGVELEGDILLTEGLSMQLSLSLLDTKIDEWLVDGVGRLEPARHPEHAGHGGISRPDVHDRPGRRLDQPERERLIPQRRPCSSKFRTR